MRKDFDRIHFDQKGDGSNKKKGIPLQTLIDLHECGYTDKEISEKVGCTRSNVTTRLNKAGYINRKGKIDNIQLRNKISDSLRGTGLGSSNPNYKGADDTEDLTQYYKGRARGIFRTLAREKLRNNPNVCQICGEQDVLEVHHIKPFQLLLDEFLIDAYSGNIETFSTELQNYEPFMDINNLIIVYPNCHKKNSLKRQS